MMNGSGRKRARTSVEMASTAPGPVPEAGPARHRTANTEGPRHGRRHGTATTQSSVHSPHRRRRGDAHEHPSTPPKHIGKTGWMSRGESGAADPMIAECGRRDDAGMSDPYNLILSRAKVVSAQANSGRIP